MNPEIKDAWVAALRSGDYAQGYGRLQRISLDGGSLEFCCLGVLCDLAVKAGVADRTPSLSYGTATFRGEGDEYGSTSYVPRSIQKWAGLDRRNPFVPLHRNGQPYAGGTLAIANDELNWDFNQIADLIERCL